MAYLELGGQRFTIPEGDMVVGSDPSAQFVVTGEGVAPHHAVLQGLPDGQVAILIDGLLVEP